MCSRCLGLARRFANCKYLLYIHIYLYALVSSSFVSFYSTICPTHTPLDTESQFLPRVHKNNSYQNVIRTLSRIYMCGKITSDNSNMLHRPRRVRMSIKSVVRYNLSSLITTIAVPAIHHNDSATFVAESAINFSSRARERPRTRYREAIARFARLDSSRA